MSKITEEMRASMNQFNQRQECSTTYYETRILQLERCIAERDVYITKKKEALTIARELIDEMDKVVEKKQAKIEELEESKIHPDHVKRLEAWLEDYREENKDLKNKLEELEAQLGLEANQEESYVTKEQFDEFKYVVNQHLRCFDK